MLFLVLLVATLATIATALNATKINPDTVATLDVPKYLGLWYQMAADAIVHDTFEKDSFCSTAVYGLNGDGTISVHNYATIGGPTAKPYTIDGYAYQYNMPDKPGQLKVKFDSSDASPFPAPYWILQLGPVNANNYYDWAIVSDNLSSSLFILARDPQEFNKKYKDSVYKTVADLGFTGFSKPIDTYQGSDCVYESTKRVAEIKRFESQK
jgi:lipocalin